MGLTMTKTDKENLKSAYYQTAYALGRLNMILSNGKTVADMKEDADFARSYVSHAQRVLREVLKRHGVELRARGENV